MGLKLIEENGQLKIFFKDRLIIQHDRDLPAFSLGNGKGYYKMYHGNFDISEELISKFPMKEYERIEETDERIKILFKYKGIQATVLFKKIDEKHVEINLEADDEEYNRFWIKLPSKESEGIYGCGEQYSEVNLKGRKVPLWVSEQGIGRNKKELLTFYADQLESAGGDWYTTYYPQPSYISTENYFCHVDDTSYMKFDFSHPDFNELECWSLPPSIMIGVADSLEETQKLKSKYFGLQPELPDWSFDGVWLGLQGGTDTVLNKINNALEKDLKISALWIQDWEGKRITAFGQQLMWNWEYEESLYPNLPETIRELKARGVRVMGYVNPFLALEGALYKEATEKGFTLQNGNGEEYIVEVTTFPVAIVDLTNPDAYNWLKNIIKKNLIGIGFSGWMADFGEYTPVDCQPFSKEAAEKLHNKFPVLWAKLNRDAVEETNNLGEIVFFTRSGYSFSQRYSTSMWHGDQMVDWSLDDGLASVIPAALSLGLSGFGISHSDIGGYTTLQNEIGNVTRTKELFMRWTELSTFTPIMRTHEGNMPQSNYQFDQCPITLKHFKRMVDIHVAIKDYLKALNRENSRHGLPFMRHLRMYYDDTRCRDVKYQYLLGRDVLCAPVIEEKTEKRTVFLPDDEWIHIWSGREYKKGEYEIEAPYGQPPVFVRKASPYKALFLKLKEV